MASKQDILLKFSADTGNVNQAVDSVKGGVEETNQATALLTQKLDRMTGGAVSGFRKLHGGFKSAVKGANAFKIALAATGIGLIVVAVGTLISYFQSTKKGADQLKVAMAALGAAFDVLRDRVSKIGGALVKFFTGDFSGALEDVKGSFTGITDEIIREVKAASDLERAMNKLKDEERAFIKVRAETNKAIAETRLRVEDENLSYAERINALESAIELEQQTVDEQLRLAEERARIAREQVALGESTEEDLQRVAEAEAAVIDLQTASLKTQKRLEGERQALLLQRKAQRDKEAAERQKAADDEKAERDKEAAERQKAADDLKKRIEDEQKAREKAYQDQLKAKQDLEDQLYKESLNAREQEELALMQEYDMRIALAGDDEGLIQAATDSFNAKIKAIDDRYRKQKADADQAQRDADDAARAADLQEEKDLRDARIQMALSALGALSQLNKAFAGESESDQKKAFERNKKFQVAQAIIQTGMAVTGALTAGGNPIKLATGAQFVEAAIAAATGVAQIATIKKTKFGSGSTPPPPGSNGGGGATGAIPQSPQLDLGFLGGGAGQTGFRTYVVSSEVSNAQQANQRINDQATLVG